MPLPLVKESLVDNTYDQSDAEEADFVVDDVKETNESDLTTEHSPQTHLTSPSPTPLVDANFVPVGSDINFLPNETIGYSLGSSFATFQQI